MQNISPLIRARLIAVNGERFDKVKARLAKPVESERESQFRNRGFNLSYRAELDASETIELGTPLPEAPGEEELPEISEERLPAGLG